MLVTLALAVAGAAAVANDSAVVALAEEGNDARSAYTEFFAAYKALQEADPGSRCQGVSEENVAAFLDRSVRAQELVADKIAEAQDMAAEEAAEDTKALAAALKDIESMLGACTRQPLGLLSASLEKLLEHLELSTYSRSQPHGGKRHSKSY